MGFVTNDPRRGDEHPGDRSELVLDLDERICPVCRRGLLPWQQTCPDDGAPARALRDVPPQHTPPAHLLDDDEDGDSGESPEVPDGEA